MSVQVEGQLEPLALSKVRIDTTRVHCAVCNRVVRNPDEECIDGLLHLLRGD